MSVTPEEADALRKTYPVVWPTAEAGIVTSVKALHAAGVPLLAGTDASNPGTTWGASMHGELELLVAAGLTPADALASATATPARAFGLGDRGRIARGLRADLLLVDGDPTRDIRATRRIVAVWRGGVRLARAVRARPPAAAYPKVTPGLVSDFEHDLGARFGAGWSATTDALVGGTSVATLSHGPRFLAVRGTVARGTAAPWAGVLFTPGVDLWAPVDLSAATTLAFTARGDGRTYSVLYFTKRGGHVPARQSFTTSKSWTKHELRLADFAGASAEDVVAIAFTAGPEPGAFAFDLDDVELR